MLERKYIKEIELNSPIARESYINHIPSIKHFAKNKKLFLNSNITFLVGENGSGKSTFIEAIAIAAGFNPEGGTLNYSFSTHDTHSELHKHLTLIKSNYPDEGFFLRAESFYASATYHAEVFWWEILLGTMVDFHTMSHGEMFLKRLNFMKGNGLYIFDEPEAALSPQNILTLMLEINRLLECNSQFIIATHSPILMAFPDAQILHFDETGIHEVSYEETEHYKLTKMFLDCPERMLKHMLN